MLYIYVIKKEDDISSERKNYPNIQDFWDAYDKVPVHKAEIGYKDGYGCGPVSERTFEGYPFPFSIKDGKICVDCSDFDDTYTASVLQKTALDAERSIFEDGEAGVYGQDQYLIGINDNATCYGDIGSPCKEGNCPGDTDDYCYHAPVDN